jgi:hypothetical protein
VPTSAPTDHAATRRNEMSQQLTFHRRAIIAAAALALVAPLSAQQSDAPDAVPTKKDPLRFTAFNVSMNTGRSGETEITIERWSTEEERKTLLDLVAAAKVGERGQHPLLSGLQKIKPRTGFIRTPNSVGWDLHYSHEDVLPDGTRQIVIGTDKPVSFAAAAGDTRAMDYPFTLIEMRFPKGGGKGEGKMLSATSISTKNGRLELEIYGQEPVRLTQITEDAKKKKGTE